MKNSLFLFAIAVLAVISVSCQPKKDDFEARQAALEKQVDKINVYDTYIDLMMLYADVIEDVYNNGKESGEYDLERVNEVENLITDYFEKLNIQGSVDGSEYIERYDCSLSERFDALEPMINEMYGYDEPEGDYEMIDENTFVIDGDTIQQIAEETLVVNGDTMSVYEFYEYKGLAGYDE